MNQRSWGWFFKKYVFNWSRITSLLQHSLSSSQTLPATLSWKSPMSPPTPQAYAYYLLLLHTYIFVCVSVCVCTNIQIQPAGSVLCYVHMVSRLTPCTVYTHYITVNKRLQKKKEGGILCLVSVTLLSKRNDKKVWRNKKFILEAQVNNSSSWVNNI